MTRLFLPLQWLAIVLWSAPHVTNAAGGLRHLQEYPPPTNSEYAFPLEAFQILYTIQSGSFAFGAESMDRMTLLEVTRRHLTDCLAADPMFVRISLYFTIRSKNMLMFQNGTKIAFGGKGYYAQPDKTDMMNRLESDTLRCFGGGNETIYVNQLRQELGWQVLERAHVMTLAGEMVEFSDGNMIMPPDNDGNDPDKPAMKKEMSLWMYLVAIGAPLCALLGLALAWCCCRMRLQLIQWSDYCCCSGKPKPRTDPKSPIWSTDHPQSQALRVESVTPSYQQQQRTIPPLSPKSDKPTEDEPSAKSDRVTVAPRKKRSVHPTRR